MEAVPQPNGSIEPSKSDGGAHLPTGSPSPNAESMPKQTRDTVLRIAVSEDGSLLLRAVNHPTGLEKRIAKTVTDTIAKDEAKSKPARSNYKCICPEGSLLVFTDRKGRPLEHGQTPPIGIVRLLPTDRPGRFKVVALFDHGGKPIPVPPAPLPIEDRPKPEVIFVSEAAPDISGAAKKPAAPAEKPSLPVKDAAPIVRAKTVGEPLQGVKPHAHGVAPSTQPAPKKPQPLKGATPEVEAALSWLLEKKQEELREKLSPEQLKAGKPTWAGKMLEVVAKARNKPDSGGKLPLCGLLAELLDPSKDVPEDHRREVRGFCREIVENAGFISHRKRQCRAARPFARQLLDSFGQETEVWGGTVAGRELSLDQVLLRLQSDQSIVREAAFNNLPNVLAREARQIHYLKDPEARAKKAELANKAVDAALKSDAYQKKPAQEKNAYRYAVDREHNRLTRDPQTGTSLPKKK